MEEIYISLGTNLGDKKQNLKHACAMLEKHCGSIVKKSSIYQTEPWGYNSSNEFFNQVVQLSSDLSASQILDKLLHIENESGRIRNSNGKYTDRSIDLDILFYGSAIIESKKLSVPHPKIQFRRFILAPLAEIAPNFTHPLLKLNVFELLIKCPDNSNISIYEQ